MSSEGTWSQDLLAELIHFSVSCAVSRHSDLLLTLPGVHPITRHQTTFLFQTLSQYEAACGVSLCSAPLCPPQVSSLQ